MSQISQQRLIEMEAEMDRFEMEIQNQMDGEDLPKVVIGSNTYNTVSAQLKMLRGASGVSVEERERKHREVAAQLKFLRATTESRQSMLNPQYIQMSEGQQSNNPLFGRLGHHGEHEDESDEDHDYDEDRSRMVDRNEPPAKQELPSSDIPLLPPPPPPPQNLSSSPFVPHQIKHRPPPPPNRPQMHGPPRMRPPPPPRPFGGPMGHGPGPMGGPPGHFNYGPGGPRPGFGPMGPGPGGPGPMRGPGPPFMGPGGPGFMGPGGPRPMMGGPPNSGMYGVSTGESHNQMEKDNKQVEEDKPKVIYSSAPMITVKKKEKKKKKKKKVKEEGEATSSITAEPQSAKSDASKDSEVTATSSTASLAVEPEDDFHVADMEIDNPYFPGGKKEKKEKKNKKIVRMAAGTTWEDQSLLEWDPDDFRLFCGDLGNEVTDETLNRAFSKYPSFTKSKVLRDKRSQKTKGYGFVSFKDPNDYVRAMREMNGKYVGNRPIKLRKSNWRERNIDVVKKKEKEKKRLGLK